MENPWRLPYFSKLTKLIAGTQGIDGIGHGAKIYHFEFRNSNFEIVVCVLCRLSSVIPRLTSDL